MIKKSTYSVWECVSIKTHDNNFAAPVYGSESPSSPPQMPLPHRVGRVTVLLKHLRYSELVQAQPPQLTLLDVTVLGDK